MMKNMEKEFALGPEKKIIGLKKINSRDFQFIEDKEFSGERLNPDIDEPSLN